MVVARSATTDIEMHGLTIPAEAEVLLLIGSANRDSDVFADGDTFRIDRADKGNLTSFGAGVHFCLGAHLARLETTIALREFAARVRHFDLVEAGIERVHSINVRGFAKLPIQVSGT